MNIGNRVIYDQDGEILFQTGEMSGDVIPRKFISELHVIDLAYGEIPYSHKLLKIDVLTKTPILEEIIIPKTAEQVRIEELENEILLMAEAEIGGVL